MVDRPQASSASIYRIRNGAPGSRRVSRQVDRWPRFASVLWTLTWERDSRYNPPDPAAACCCWHCPMSFFTDRTSNSSIPDGPLLLLPTTDTLSPAVTGSPVSWYVRLPLSAVMVLPSVATHPTTAL